jgi:hypothetical protein
LPHCLSLVLRKVIRSLGRGSLTLQNQNIVPARRPKSQTANIQVEGQDQQVTITGVGADGSPIRNMFTMAFDATSHPSRNPAFDAVANTRVDAYTIISSRTKAGKLVGTQTLVVSPDGKTLTTTTIGPGAFGPQVNNIAVWDKQ